MKSDDDLPSDPDAKPNPDKYTWKPGDVEILSTGGDEEDDKSKREDRCPPAGEGDGESGEGCPCEDDEDCDEDCECDDMENECVERDDSVVGRVAHWMECKYKVDLAGVSNAEVMRRAAVILGASGSTSSELRQRLDFRLDERQFTRPRLTRRSPAA